MRDPRPREGGEASDLERRLLEAARQEEPSPEMLHRMERGLGIAGIAGLAAAASMTAATSTAIAAAAARTSGLSARAGMAAGVKSSLFGAKAIGLVALIAGGALGVRLLLSHPARPPRDARSLAPVAAAVSRPEPVAAPSGSPAVAPALAAPAPIASPPAARPGRVSADLRGEIALIDGARTALAAGSPRQAMHLLQQYNVRYPRGVLMPEALVIRIEALDRDGQHARARGLARAFVAGHPHSPLADRIARLQLGKGTP